MITPVRALLACALLFMPAAASAEESWDCWLSMRDEVLMACMQGPPAADAGLRAWRRWVAEVEAEGVPILYVPLFNLPFQRQDAETLGQAVLCRGGPCRVALHGLP